MRRWLAGALLALSAAAVHGQEPEDPAAKTREVIQAAINAMGGDAYLNVRNAYSYGRYFAFDRGLRGFTYYSDWTVFDPILSHNVIGKGKRATVNVVNLELNKGWLREGEDDVVELTEEQLKAWRDGLKDNLDLLLRKRRHEEGMTFFYYGPGDVAGTGEFEAVEFLDATNAGVIVFFRVDNHLPAKVEYSYVDGVGVRHTRETEFYNWHEIDGVLSPLRIDIYLDDEMVQQFFLEELDYDVQIPPGHFLEPVLKKN